MNFTELAAARYSVRKYEKRPIPDEVMTEILNTGNLAPTAKNNQAHRIYVLKSPEALAKIAELSPCTFGAPAVLLFTYNKDEVFRYGRDKQLNSGDEDCSIVATHIMLKAAEMGLGTCWVNMFQPEDTETAFSIPENEKAVLLLPIGYPAADSVPSVRHAPAKPLSEIVRYL